MQAIILRSKDGSRFHFGKALAVGKNDANALASVSEYLHSDTLWSALVNAWALSSPDTIENFISECRNEKFKLSSAFYCLEYNHKSIFFLPKPASLNLCQFNEPKKLKKIKFISKGIWENGLLPEDWFNPEKCTLLQNETMVALGSEIDESITLFACETSPKVRARDVSDREDGFYYQTDLFLLGNKKYSVNWYFITENLLPENLQNDFNTAMQMLVNFGVGGERSSGCGSLTEYATTDFQVEIENVAYRSSLSLIAPNEKELTENSLYQIIKRGGRFLEKGKALSMVQMLLEGAVFNTDIKGKIVKLNANPPILRYGLNLDIPLHNNFINGLL
ncbi:MAG: type III-A CRISPR-associated RAMP protein Csm4 [Acholeplasmataceae bacterium]